jgi:hypothetical protein
MFNRIKEVFTKNVLIAMGAGAIIGAAIVIVIGIIV